MSFLATLNCIQWLFNQIGNGARLHKFTCLVSTNEGIAKYSNKTEVHKNWESHQKWNNLEGSRVQEAIAVSSKTEDGDMIGKNE